jgi:hypothetical protein
LWPASHFPRGRLACVRVPQIMARAVFKRGTDAPFPDPEALTPQDLGPDARSPDAT